MTRVTPPSHGFGLMVGPHGWMPHTPNWVRLCHRRMVSGARLQQGGQPDEL
jgi:hypothetical protein